MGNLGIHHKGEGHYGITFQGPDGRDWRAEIEGQHLTLWNGEGVRMMTTKNVVGQFRIFQPEEITAGISCLVRALADFAIKAGPRV